MWDVDGNEYIDYVLAWGPVILGHCHPQLTEAMRRQAELPFAYGAQHELEFQVSERIQGMVPCAERVLLTSSGTEAVQAALRLARGHTGRNLVLRFEGHYHGWLDSVLLSYRGSLQEMGSLETPNIVLGSRGQVSNSAENVLVAAWNDPKLLKKIFEKHGSEIAAVITEPVLCNSGCLMPEKGYLEELREITAKYGSLLIFDEVITGFRIAPGGAQSYFGITPDLATLGKAIAGGVTMSALAGKKEIMEKFLTEGIVFAGTFNSNPLGTAAARATLDEIARDEGAALKNTNRLGIELMEGIRDAAFSAGVPVQVTGFGAAFSVHFTARSELRSYRDTLYDDKARLQKYLRLALDEGLFLLPDGRMYVSTSHTEREIQQTLKAIGSVMQRLS